MGYCTTYRLTWKNSNPQIDDLISSAIKTNQEKDCDFLYGITPEGDSSDSCKWYEHETEMKQNRKNYSINSQTLSPESRDVLRHFPRSKYCLCKHHSNKGITLILHTKIHIGKIIL